MVNSVWRNTWREDFDRVLCVMSERERLALRRWGFVSPPGRRVFVDAADRLALDIEYDTYIMEQAAPFAESLRPAAAWIARGGTEESPRPPGRLANTSRKELTHAAPQTSSVSCPRPVSRR